MKPIFPVAAMLCTGIALLSGCASVARHDDLSAMQGAWVGHADAGGQNVEYHMNISGDSFKFEVTGGKEWYAGKVTLNPNTSPRQADFLIEDCPAQQYIKKTSRAIYRIEGTTLTIAGNEPGRDVVPTGFDPASDPQTRVVVLNRQQ